MLSAIDLPLPCSHCSYLPWYHLDAPEGEQQCLTSRKTRTQRLRARHIHTSGPTPRRGAPPASSTLPVQRPLRWPASTAHRSTSTTTRPSARSPAPSAKP